MHVHGNGILGFFQNFDTRLYVDFCIVFLNVLLLGKDFDIVFVNGVDNARNGTLIAFFLTVGTELGIIALGLLFFNLAVVTVQRRRFRNQFVQT